MFQLGLALGEFPLVVMTFLQVGTYSVNNIGVDMKICRYIYGRLASSPSGGTSPRHSEGGESENTPSPSPFMLESGVMLTGFGDFVNCSKVTIWIITPLTMKLL